MTARQPFSAGMFGRICIRFIHQITRMASAETVHAFIKTKAMIDNFEEYTAHLTTYERDMLVPLLSNELKHHVGAKNAIRNKELCRIFTLKGHEGLREARVRKCINYIRMNGLVPQLIANCNGYYVATSIDEMEKYITSLDERAKAIWAMRAALKRDISGRLFI